MSNPGALEGVRIIDAGQIIAGPFAATLLGEFGADVIKVEQPGIGDASRGAGGMAPEFAQNSRNKRSITLDLRRPEGQGLFKRLVAVSDVVVENFLPGTMERWNLGYDDLAAVNSGIVMLRTSGYGQTGPYKHRYSFDRIGMAFAGLTYLTGMPDHPPVRPGYFIADYGTGFLGAFGVLAALRHRDGPGNGRGQVVDVSLYETIWRMSGVLANDYASTGKVRERMGNTFTGVSPAEQFETADGQYIVIHAGSDRTFERLCLTMGDADLAKDSRIGGRGGRVKHMDELHRRIRDWVKDLSLVEALEALDAGGVPASPVNTIAHIFGDPQFEDRENLIHVPDPVLGDLVQPGVTPKLSLTPGGVRCGAPVLGQHNREIYCELLNVDFAEYEDLQRAGVI
jgi:crotonobetainyl-CoA:carnitine CoA-transferase CaiB-like acyl-CoA transferase